MRESKHTAGPWTISDADKLVVIAGRGVNVEQVAVVLNSRRLATGQPQHDARLIAAAPDLLACLKHAVHWHDQLSPADIARFEEALAKAGSP